uniref:Uncharacterized protein n=1 Tax=Spongospora subterranea TaxID=70186 RepID=A0A0H5QS76_9EUKA|eukprot:CRZ04820.1 hypothetical protein [Spongospora subterranea]
MYVVTKVASPPRHVECLGQSIQHTTVTSSGGPTRDGIAIIMQSLSFELLLLLIQLLLRCRAGPDFCWIGSQCGIPGWDCGFRCHDSGEPRVNYLLALKRQAYRFTVICELFIEG